jgi:glutaconate CoA-transferase subunit A
MKNKLLSLPKAVSLFTRDGMVYASGAAAPVGSDTVVFARELARQKRKNIHYMCHCSTQSVNLLCALGYVDKAEGGFSALEVYGFANGIRRAVESGRTLWEDYSNLSMPLRYFGAAMNWPFVPATINIGSDLQRRSAFKPDEYPCATKIPEITDPFTGKIYGALPVAKPQLASIHVTMADVEGNAIFLGTEWGRFELARAAEKVILVADKIVDTDCMRQFPNLVKIHDFLVEAVVPWEFGCWPACSNGLYDSDEEHFFLMNKLLATEEGTAEYMDKYVHSWATQEEYLDVIGRGKLATLSGNITTAHLMEPFRKYVKSGDQVEQLMQESVFADQ